MKKSLILTAGSLASLLSISNADQVIADDLIVQGSIAAGFDAVNNESFGADTIRLKENNTRINFDDTSASGGFPANDWTITANDQASGGANKFSIDDITGARTPFTIIAGAPTNSLYVNSSGNLGLGTASPVLDAHMVTGNTPAIRMEQDGSSGWTPQTWDMAGNEANFFIRDVTSGSLLPFRIRPGAPTSSIDISANGNVGIGTATPTGGSLHIRRTDGTSSLFVEEASSTIANRALLSLTNNGGANLNMINSSATGDVGGGGWRINSKDGLYFAIRPQVMSQPGQPDFVLERGGKLTLLGTVNATAFNTTSDKNLKKDIISVEPRDILKKVTELPIGEWSFIAGEENVRHIGPMAQDFQKQFGLGPSDKTINLMDSTGVALAAIQGLTEILEERETEIKELSEQMKELREEIRSLKSTTKKDGSSY